MKYRTVVLSSRHTYNKYAQTAHSCVCVFDALRIRNHLCSLSLPEFVIADCRQLPRVLCVLHTDSNFTSEQSRLKKKVFVNQLRCFEMGESKKNTHTRKYLI